MASQSSEVKKKEGMQEAARWEVEHQPGQKPAIGNPRDCPVPAAWEMEVQFHAERRRGRGGGGLPPSSISGWLGRAGLKGKWTGDAPLSSWLLSRWVRWGQNDMGSTSSILRTGCVLANTMLRRFQCLLCTLWTKCLTMDPRYVPDMRSDGSGLDMSSYVSSQYLSKCLKGCVGSHSSSSPAQEQAPVPVRWEGPGQDFPGPVSCECVGGWMVSVSLMCGEASCNLK